jgi:molybdopterin adenylyltransferase
MAAATGDDRGDDRRRQATVVTASDGVHHGTREDASGAAVEAQLVSIGVAVRREVVPDDRSVIADLLIRLADVDGRALVVVTGGTGFGPRDVTPEAIRGIMRVEVPGFGELMRMRSVEKTPNAILSRGLAAVVGQALVVALPGKPAGAVECLGFVRGALDHAVKLAQRVPTSC